MLPQPLKKRIQTQNKKFQEKFYQVRNHFQNGGLKRSFKTKKKRKRKTTKKYVPQDVYKSEYRKFEEFKSKNPDYKYGSDYLFFIEKHFSKNLGTKCTLYVFEEYLKSLQYATFVFPDHTEKLFSKGEEMINWIIKNDRKGSNIILHELIILMRKTNVIREPDYFLQMMIKMKINKPSFKVSSSLITSYTNTASKVLNSKYVYYAEKAFLNMCSNFKFVQVYLYNAMLNMYTKNGNSKKFWEIYDMMKKESGDLTNVYTYGSLLETCLYVDKNPTKGLMFYEEFKSKSFDPSDKHYTYIHGLGKKLMKLKRNRDEMK